MFQSKKFVLILIVIMVYMATTKCDLCEVLN